MMTAAAAIASIAMTAALSLLGLASTRRAGRNLGYQYDCRSDAESEPDLLRIPKAGGQISA
jgi:hypothetical protein